MRWIKTRFEHTYERLTDDIMTFSIDSVCGVNYVVMADRKGTVTYLSEDFESEVFARLVLDKLMMFVTDEDFDIIDMDVVVMLAVESYDARTDLPD